MPSPKISTFREIVPLIYSWTTPDIPKYDGWEKIGYTEQETADARIAQQASQLSVRKDKVELTRFPGHPILGVVPGKEAPDGSSSEISRGVPA